MTIGWYFLLDLLADGALVAAFILFGTAALSGVSEFETARAVNPAGARR